MRRQAYHHRIDRTVHFGLVFGGAGDDQRRARLIDQDGIHFVDDGEGMAALGHGVQRVFHVVAQIVEAEFVVGAVGDVGGIGDAPLLIRQPMHDAARGQAQEAVDLPHPFAVALGEIVVDRHHMHAFAGQRVQIDGQGGDQGLAFAGLHLGDIAAMQHHAADQLDVEMALAEGALGGLAHHRKGFGQNIVQGLARFQPRLEGGGHGLELFVRHGLEARLQGVDLGHSAPERLDLALVGGAENLFGERAETQHEILCYGPVRG